MARNKKRVLVPNVMGAAGWDVLKEREDVEPVAFPTTISPGDFNALLRSDGNRHAAAKLLGIDIARLEKKLAEHGLDGRS